MQNKKTDILPENGEEGAFAVGGLAVCRKTDAFVG
jgi:hypothetical protein